MLVFRHTELFCDRGQSGRNDGGIESLEQKRREKTQHYLPAVDTPPLLICLFLGCEDGGVLVRLAWFRSMIACCRRGRVSGLDGVSFWVFCIMLLPITNILLELFPVFVLLIFSPPVLHCEKHRVVLGTYSPYWKLYKDRRA